MKKTYIGLGIVVIILILLIFSIRTYLNYKENYRNISDARHEEIIGVVEERLGDSISSAIVNDEGKKIEAHGQVLYFVKLELKKDKIDDVKNTLDDRAQNLEEEKTQGHFGIEYVEEINNGNVLANYKILSGGKHNETLVEEMWIVEIDEKTYLYYIG